VGQFERPAVGRLNDRRGAALPQTVANTTPTTPDIHIRPRPRPGNALWWVSLYALLSDVDKRERWKNG